MPTYGADRYVLVLKMTYNKNAAESVKLEFAAVCHINIKSRQRHKDVFVGNKLNALVNEFIRRDRKEEALALAWDCFECYPDCQYGYKFLRSTARSCHQGKLYLTKALDFLRKRLTVHNQAISARTEMVNILLCEKDYPQALEIAESGLCAHQTLCRLAEAIAKTQPKASARLIKRPLDQYLPLVGDRPYAESVRLLKLYKEYLLGW